MRARPVVAVFGLGEGCGATTVARALGAELAARDPAGACAVSSPSRSGALPLGSAPRRAWPGRSARLPGSVGAGVGPPLPRRLRRHRPAGGRRPLPGAARARRGTDRRSAAHRPRWPTTSCSWRPAGRAGAGRGGARVARAGRPGPARRAQPRVAAGPVRGPRRPRAARLPDGRSARATRAASRAASSAARSPSWRTAARSRG